MKKTTLRVTLLASLGILLAFLIAVGATYSLWNQEVKVVNHLESGNLSVKLERTNLVKHKLGSFGYLEDQVNSNIKDFTDTTTSTSNIFDLESNEKVVPGSYYESTMKLSNLGSVAFDYTVSFVLDSDSINELANQIKVYVDDKEVDYLYTDTNKGTIKLLSDSLDLEVTSKEFKVKIEFIDLESSVNNTAEDETINFDLVVKATQKTQK